VDTHFYTPDHTPREAYYLCVSALVPYKRIDLAVRTCNHMGRRLVVIGTGPEGRRLARLAGRTVELVGWRTSRDIRDHLRRARALLFPGNEDFGIVPVEAQACGTPVIAFGQGGVTETVIPANDKQLGTGVFFDQQTPESLGRAIEVLEARPDWFSPELARQQAERFAADRFERALVGYLEEVAASRTVPGAAR
jgi:glycosyltransferase involved in cell wall biosynthesis